MFYLFIYFFTIIFWWFFFLFTSEYFFFFVFKPDKFKQFVLSQFYTPFYFVIVLVTRWIIFFFFFLKGTISFTNSCKSQDRHKLTALRRKHTAKTNERCRSETSLRDNRRFDNAKFTSKQLFWLVTLKHCSFVVIKFNSSVTTLWRFSMEPKSTTLGRMKSEAKVVSWFGRHEPL